MAGADDIRRQMDQVKRTVKRAVDEARTQARESGDRDGATNVNVARRSNIVVVTNSGEPGSVQSASAHQSAEITQRGGQSDEQGS